MRTAFWQSFEQYEGLKCEDTLPTSPQSRLLRRQDPTILRNTGVAQRALGYISISLQVLFSHLSLARIPEVGQPLKLRTMLATAWFALFPASDR